MTICLFLSVEHMFLRIGSILQDTEKKRSHNRLGISSLKQPNKKDRFCTEETEYNVSRIQVKVWMLKRPFESVP